MQFIFRTKVEVDFTVLKNDCIRDKTLSWEARGVLHYLLSMPGDWRVSMEDLYEQSPSAKEYAMSKIMKELAKKRYIIRRKMQDNKGLWVWVTLVFDTPLEKNMDKKKQEEIDAEMQAILGPEILERTRKIKEQDLGLPSKAEVLASAAGIGEKDPLESYPERSKPRLAEFIKASQIAPTKAKKADWIATDNEWREMGVKPADVPKMYQYTVNQGLDVSRPGSITFAYYALQRQETQVTDDTKYFRVAQ